MIKGLGMFKEVRFRDVSNDSFVNEDKGLEMGRERVGPYAIAIIDMWVNVSVVKLL